MTRFLHITLSAIFALGLSSLAMAQTAPAPEKKPAETKSDTKPAPKKGGTAADEMDIDAMFKRGEEQAKKGPSCRKPDPIA